MTHNCSAPTAQNVHFFDARGIAKRFRHAAIFGAFKSLRTGEVMHFINDHDPLPLLDQLKFRYVEGIQINYISREPGLIELHFKRTR